MDEADDPCPNCGSECGYQLECAVCGAELCFDCTGVCSACRNHLCSACQDDAARDCCEEEDE